VEYQFSLPRNCLLSYGVAIRYVLMPRRGELLRFRFGHRNARRQHLSATQPLGERLPTCYLHFIFLDGIYWINGIFFFDNILKDFHYPVNPVNPVQSLFRLPRKEQKRFLSLFVNSRGVRQLLKTPIFCAMMIGGRSRVIGCPPGCSRIV
jgi:hypothetical protein